MNYYSMNSDNKMNYYSILGVNKNCSRKDIRSAYLVAAKKHHPDKSDDSNAFINLHNAYETLYNEQKRYEYDRRFFKTQRMIPSPIIINAHLTLEEVQNGVEKIMMFSKTVMMDTEKKIVQSEDFLYPCEPCNGIGFHKSNFHRVNCYHCNGRGYLELYPGKYSIGEKMHRLYYKFPAGVKENSHFTITKTGNRDLLDPLLVGNIEIHISYIPHTLYKLDYQYNLVQTNTISVFDALIGFDMNVGFNKEPLHVWPLYGAKEQILKNKGLRQKDRYTDLIIKFNITYPVLSEKQNLLIQAGFAEFLSKKISISEKNTDVNPKENNITETSEESISVLKQMIESENTEESVFE